jgi:hypothetical protein
MLDDIWLQRREEVIQLARQQDSWEFLICLANKVFETENIKDSDPSILLTPINHSFTYAFLRANGKISQKQKQSAGLPCSPLP